MAMKYQLVGGNYQVIKRIGGGAFGDIYGGICVTDNTEVAIKIESHESKCPQLMNEANVYRMLSNSPGFPTFLYYGSEEKFKALVIELLGPSLHDLFIKCNHRFSLKTILMLADQQMARLEAIHTLGYVHRDIKPDNFLMGLGDKSKKVYLIDFGMSRQFKNPKTQKHIRFRRVGSVFGTLRYSSLRAQKGEEQSRRDDLESLMYCMIYFYKGKLPWIGLTAANETQKMELIMEKKKSSKIDDLCDAFPPMIGMLMEYIRNLRFEEDPDYVYMRQMLHIVFLDLNLVYDLKFDWTQLWEGRKDRSTGQEPIEQKSTSSLYYTVSENSVF
ncbi:casein kinase I-like [Drosophila madeirensis]|uniref:non-specific serine/threonine protein kinase n=1 Tax=Drosophila madeirensis TaxID=30013 RepID=A0AAU9FHT4_DROMD